jgi:hypothetical protein
MLEQATERGSTEIDDKKLKHVWLNFMISGAAGI